MLSFSSSVFLPPSFLRGVRSPRLPAGTSNLFVRCLVVQVSSPCLPKRTSRRYSSKLLCIASAPSSCVSSRVDGTCLRPSSGSKGTIPHFRKAALMFASLFLLNASINFSSSSRGKTSLGTLLALPPLAVFFHSASIARQWIFRGRKNETSRGCVKFVEFGGKCTKSISCCRQSRIKSRSK